MSHLVQHAQGESDYESFPLSVLLLLIPSICILGRYHPYSLFWNSYTAALGRNNGSMLRQ